MNDEYVMNFVLVLALCVLIGVLAVPMVLNYYNPPRHEEAIAAGIVVGGMSEAEVAEVWGSPDHIVTSGLTTPGIFKAAELYSWIYYNPYRKVIFANEGLGERVMQIQTSE